MVKSRYIGDGHPTFNRNPYNGYINTYYRVDDHPLLYGNNGSLDPGTLVWKNTTFSYMLLFVAAYNFLKQFPIDESTRWGPYQTPL